MKQLSIDETGEATVSARVEIKILGPVMWSPLLRFRVFMDHKPEDHLTVWHVRWVTKYLGSYTPPGWFLKLIGQVKG